MSIDAEPRQQFIQGADARLSLWLWPARSRPEMAPTLLILHGMRDQARAFDAIARSLADEMHVLVPDLRGHGDSGKSDAYSLGHFLADVLFVVEAMQLPPVHLLGHSLGGHIAAQFAAGFPERLLSLSVVEGLGPPDMEGGRVGKVQSMERWRNGIQQIGRHAPHRSMPDYEDAAQRLLANNPRLAETEALRLAKLGTEPHPQGGLRWKFDPRSQDVWSSFDHTSNEQRWQQVQTPTQILCGALAMEYWLGFRRGEERAIPNYPYEQLQRKIKLFGNATQVEIHGAGHMIHYDQPSRLIDVTRRFVNQHSR